MKAVKIQNNRNIYPSGLTNGIAVLNGDKLRATPQGQIEAFNLAVYENGRRVYISETRLGAIKYCNRNIRPNTVFHIRKTNKLVYFHEYGHDPVFFRGFHIGSWKYKPYGRALIDYDNHTPKEVTEQYDAIAYALEQTANQNETHDQP